MKTLTLTFTKTVQGSEVDAFGNPIETTEEIAVGGCLIAPITEPTNHREQQALEQGKVRAIGVSNFQAGRFWTSP